MAEIFGQLTQEIKDGIMEFMLEEVKEKVYGGITYAMFSDDSEAGKASMVKYAKLRKTIEEEYGEPKADGIFRMHVVKRDKTGTSVVYDLSVVIAEEVIKMLQQYMSAHGVKEFEGELIGDGPLKRHEKDINEMAKKIDSETAGMRLPCKYIVAIYSRNIVPRVTITGEDKTGNKVQYTYNAYALRFWELKTVSEVLMTKYKKKIASASIIEVLPSKTGVAVELRIEKI